MACASLFLQAGTKKNKKKTQVEKSGSIVSRFSSGLVPLQTRYVYSTTTVSQTSTISQHCSM